MKNKAYGLTLFIFLLVIALIAITRFTELKPHWGSLEFKQASTITVTGFAKQDITNQVADFTVGMESIEASKEEALNKVNEAMNQVIEQVKNFGVDEQDIQTQTANVYQETEYIQENTLSIGTTTTNRGDAQKGDWIANNSVHITLRNVEQAEDLLNILNASAANYVYGPNFGLDDAQSSSDELLSVAVSNAREKAEQVAAANGQKLGKIISLTENGADNVYPLYENALSSAASGSLKTASADLETGSSTTSKTVTVTFELN